MLRADKLRRTLGTGEAAHLASGLDLLSSVDTTPLNKSGAAQRPGIKTLAPTLIIDIFLYK